MVEVLDRHGLDHRLLKGLALANTVYPDPLQRYFHDLDVLVRGDQLADVVRVLTEHTGFRRRVPELRPASIVASRSRSRWSIELGGELDLHRTLVRGDVWIRARPRRVVGVALDRCRWLVSSCPRCRPRVSCCTPRLPPPCPTCRPGCRHCATSPSSHPPTPWVPSDLARLATHHGVVAPVAHGVQLTEQGLQVSLGELGTWAAGVEVDAHGRRQLAEYGADSRFRTQALDVARVLPRADRVRYLTALTLPSRGVSTRRGDWSSGMAPWGQDR